MLFSKLFNLKPSDYAMWKLQSYLVIFSTLDKFDWYDVNYGNATSIATISVGSKAQPKIVVGIT